MKPETPMIATDGREAILKATILIVDDERGPRESLRMILKPTFDVLIASGGQEAIKIVKERAIDLVTLDLNMPGVKGLEVLRSIRSISPKTEVIIITGFATVQSAVEGIRYGVHDFITKPFDIGEVMATIDRALKKQHAVKQLNDFLEEMGTLLGRDRPTSQALSVVEADSSLVLGMRQAIQDAFQPVAESNSHQRIFEFVEVLADTLESKDEYTHGHSRRVSYYASILAEGAGLDMEVREEVRLASFLHDIGKVGVSNRLIMKDGRLTAEEHAVVSKHPEIGESLLLPLNLAPGIIQAVRHHHEHYDGNGYPDRIAGQDIPLGARIILIADAYDAMNSDRPYRKALPMQAIIREFTKHAGTQFDPELAAQFADLLENRSEALNINI